MIDKRRIHEETRALLSESVEHDKASTENNQRLFQLCERHGVNGPDLHEIARKRAQMDVARTAQGDDPDVMGLHPLTMFLLGLRIGREENAGTIEKLQDDLLAASDQVSTQEEDSRA